MQNIYPHSVKKVILNEEKTLNKLIIISGRFRFSLTTRLENRDIYTLQKIVKAEKVVVFRRKRGAEI